MYDAFHANSFAIAVDTIISLISLSIDCAHFHSLKKRISVDGTPKFARSSNITSGRPFSSSSILPVHLKKNVFFFCSPRSTISRRSIPRCMSSIIPSYSRRARVALHHRGNPSSRQIDRNATTARKNHILLLAIFGGEVVLTWGGGFLAVRSSPSSSLYLCPFRSSTLSANRLHSPCQHTSLPFYLTCLLWLGSVLF